MKEYCFDNWKDADKIKEELSEEKCELLHDILTTCDFIDNRPDDFEWFSDKDYGCENWYDVYEKGYLELDIPEKYKSLEQSWIYSILLVREGNEDLEYLFWSIDDIFDVLENEKRENISIYIESNLKNFELEGVEISEDDIEWVVDKMKKGASLEESCDELLQGIRDCLDEGLEDIEEDLD